MSIGIQELEIDEREKRPFLLAVDPRALRAVLRLLDEIGQKAQRKDGPNGS